MNKKSFILCLAMMILPLLASAHNFEVDGIYYNITSETDKTVEVTYGGKSYNTYPNEYSGNVEIPSTISLNNATYKITSIGYQAFRGCSDVISVKIPNSVKSIAAEAFCSCSSLSYIELPDSLLSIENSCFLYCTNLTSIKIPQNVTWIGKSAFEECHNLVSITMPEGLTSIGTKAFRSCSSLTSITIPKNVISIANEAFSPCSNLKEIIFEDGKKPLSIGYDTYDSKYEGRGAFYYCPLEKVYLGRDLVYESSSHYGYSPFFKKENLTSVTIGDSVTFIGNYAFSQCNNLKSLTIGKGIKSINSYAFSSCGSLKDVDVHIKSVGSWLNVQYGNGAYPGDNEGNVNLYLDGNLLENVIVPSTVNSIPYNAFCGCSSITSIIIPKEVSHIGDHAFDNCFSLQEVIFEDGSEILSLGNNRLFASTTDNIGEGLFYDCPLKTVYLGRNLNYNVRKQAGYSPFYNIESLTSLSIGDSVNIINEHAFQNCNNLGEVHVNSIESWCNIQFKDYTSNPLSYANLYINKEMIVDLVFPNTVKYIKSFSFYGSKITSVVVPNNIESIGTYAFSKCNNLKNLTIGRNISSIEDYAFSDCNEIENVYAFNPKAFTCNENIFSTDTYNNAILYVPTGREFAYEKATPWSKFYIESMRKFTVKYMVDGEVLETKDVEYGTTITLPEAPTKEGHTFSGWSEVPETMPAEDVTIEGTFIINKYLVSFKIGDEVIASDSLEYGATIVAPEAPAKEGYTFNGWGEVDATVPAHDVTCEGSYSVNSYILTYIVDGEKYHQESIKYGTAIEAIKEPTKEGYTFSGWSEVPEKMPANDVTIEGTFTQLLPVYLTINQADNGHVKQHLVAGTVCTFTIEAAEGWEIHSVTFNGEDVTAQLTEEGTFTTPALQTDAVLNIAYEKIGTPTMVAKAQASRIKVQGHRGTLRVTGATEGDGISVYTTDGTLVTQESAEESDTEITLPTGQVYIVKVADKVVKIGM